MGITGPEGVDTHPIWDTHSLWTPRNISLSGIAPLPLDIPTPPFWTYSTSVILTPGHTHLLLDTDPLDIPIPASDTW